VHWLRIAFAATATVTAVAAVGASCALPGFNRVGAGTGGGGGETVLREGGSDAPEASASTGSCMHAVPPDPPGVPPDDGGFNDIILALHSIDLGETQYAIGPSTITIGLDLDDQCTCEGQGPTCIGPNGNKDCDGVAGRDNAAAGLFNLLTLALGSNEFGSQYFSDQMAGGRYTLLLRIRGYNGTGNDFNVEVDQYVSPSTTGNLIPNWDGQDIWNISAACIDGGEDGSVDTPLYVDPNAYVTNGVLVANLPAVALNLGGESSVSITLTAGVIVASLVPQASGQYAILQGTIAARWKSSDVFKSVSSYRDNAGNALCTNSAAYDIGHTAICDGLDILAEIASPAAMCDALSIGANFTAGAAMLGPIVPYLSPDGGCTPATDPANDSCLTPMMDGGTDGSAEDAGNDGSTEDGGKDGSAEDAGKDGGHDAG
jgi:hypothetical protein